MQTSLIEQITCEQIAYQKLAVLVLCLILRNAPICIDLKEDISVKYFPCEWENISTFV